MTQVSAEHRRRGRAIDVIVAKDCDRFSAGDGIRQPHRGGMHIGERMRVRHQRPHGRIKKACDLVYLDAAAGKNARQQLGHMVMALRDRKRAPRATLVEPVAPGASASRALDPKKEALFRDDRRRQRDCHVRPSRIASKKFAILDEPRALRQLLV